MSEGDTWENALIGAIAGFIAGSLVPAGPVIGGGVAGYLQGGDRSDGVRVGAYAGLLAFIPFVLVITLLSSIIGALGFGMGTMFTGEGMLFGVGAAMGGFVLVVGLILGLVYFVGFSALGGYLGNYVKNDTDIDV